MSHSAKTLGRLGVTMVAAAALLANGGLAHAVSPCLSAAPPRD